MEPNIKKIGGTQFYTDILKSPVHIMAPMVDGSDLAFRLLARRYNTHLTYTPMLYSRVFADSPKYRQKELQCSPQDRPLVVQFCGTSVEDLLPAAVIAQKYCDAIDINLGCPQMCAAKGGYGAFLLEHPELVYPIVEALHQNLEIPVFCKIRILPSLEETIQFAKGLELHGCQLLVVHGRTKEQKGHNSGPCDWDAIKAIKAALTIPVIANGGIQKFEDIERCLSYTGCEAVMSAEAILRNPAFFSREVPDPCDLIVEYLEICKQYKTSRKYIHAHVWGLLVEPFNLVPEMRGRYRKAKSLDECISIFRELKSRVMEIKGKKTENSENIGNIGKSESMETESRLDTMGVNDEAIGTVITESILTN